MKRIIGLFVLILLTAVFIRLRSLHAPASPYNPQPRSTSPSMTPPAPQLPKELIIAGDIQKDGGTYIIVGKEVMPDVPLSLIPNFTERLSGQRLAETHGCAMAINGGFYTKESQPLGWFVSEGSEAGQLIKSNLVTGFFWQDTDGKRHISRTAPSKGDVDFVLQTGPFMDVRDQQLQLISDEPARRSLLGIDDNDRLYMFSVILKENTFSGPLLADIPLLFSQSEVKQTVNMRVLLNLDGGSASFFYSPKNGQAFMLSELTPIGSVLCIKQ